MATSTAELPKADANIVTTTPSQDYIDDLLGKLTKAKRDLSEASGKAKDAQKDFDVAYAWYVQIKTYWENIQATDDLAGEVMKVLTTFENQSKLVGENSSLNAQAIRILILEAQKTSESTEKLKGLMKVLLDKLDCITNPELDTNASIMAMVSKLKTAIDDALRACIDAITATLELLQCALLINCAIEGENGLTENIADLKTNLTTGQADDLEDEDLRALGRAPTFPLTDCDRDYYDRIKVIHERAAAAIKDGGSDNADDWNPNKKDLLDEANREKTRAQSNHDALEGAHKAAQAAKTC